MESRNALKKKVNNWEKVIFSSLCTVTRGASPRPIHDWLAKKGVPWIKISDATSEASRFINKTKQYIKEQGREKSVVVHPGDLILSNSATPGIPRFVNIEACIHDGWLLLRNFKNLDKRYCYYLLIYSRPRLLSQGNGSVFTNLKTDILKNLHVQIPPLSEQKAIADFLGALDDKIELNRKTNETLEAMAQAIFKSWFIDFDPVKAKMEGKKPSGMDAETAALFPDSFEDSPLGKIPKGWNVVRLGEVLNEIESGARPKGGASTVRTEVPSIGAENILGIGKYDYSKNKYVSKEFIGNYPKAVVKNGDVLVYKDGASLGRKSYFDHNFPFGICAINEHVFRLRVNNQLSQLFLYFWLDQPSVTQQIIDLNSGSAQPGINKQSMRSLKILLPPKDIVDKFEKLVGPYTELLLNNCKENQVSANLRDSLLPKLLSGEIQVKGFG